MTTEIAISGDWHANLKWMDKCLEKVSEQGIHTLYHLGDFAYKMAESTMYLMDHIADTYDVTVKFIDGNHDNHDILTHDHPFESHFSDRIIYLPRAYSFIVDNTKFLTLGGAVSVDKKWRGPGEWWPRDTISIQEAYRAASVPDVDIMLTHDCPSGVLELESGGTFPADALAEAEAHRDMLRSVVESVRPTYLFHGHYHQYHEGVVGDTKVVGLDRDGSSNNVIAVTVGNGKIHSTRTII